MSACATHPIALQCGPAQLGREMAGTSGRMTMEQLLQCGPAQLGREIKGKRGRDAESNCFNAARPNWAGKSGVRALCRRSRGLLQCGPAQLGREMRLVARCIMTITYASMRPGPIGPGNGRFPGPGGSALELQCGPAQLGREILCYAGTDGANVLLQCGPAQLGREMSARRSGSPRSSSLQCGPAQLGREIADRLAPAARRLHRFNAARPNWAGKLIAQFQLTESLHLLQCGPAQLGREIAVPLHAVPRQAMLQCGPAQLGREIR